MRFVTAALVGLLLFGACSTAAEDDGGESESQIQGNEANCEKVAPAIVNGIASDNWEPLDSAAVRSDDFEKVWMVAIRFRAEGVEDIGVWAVTNLRQPGATMSAEAIAEAFSDFPRGSSADPIQGTEHGIEEARACL